MSAPTPPTAVPSPLGARKADHLRIAASETALHRHPAGLDRYRLRHRALPERDLDQVDTTTTLLGRELAAPLLVSAMTGGTSEAAAINERLARAALRHGIGMVLGSGRPLLAAPELLPTYLGADRAPLLVANLGAAQLLEPQGLDDAERLVGLLRADALSIHLNPLQEAVQPEGEPQFAGLIARMAETCQRLAPLPVVVKEVGFGLAADDVAALQAAGVHAVDVAGAGGTNWALVEGQRDPAAREVASAFSSWGTPTADAVIGARAIGGPDLEIVASGGIADGVQAATALALGATAAGLARQLLLAAQADRAEHAIDVLVRQLRIATWLTGVASSSQLSCAHLDLVG